MRLLALVVLVGVLAPAAAATSEPPTIQAAAAAIVGQPTRVVCESAAEWAADPNKPGAPAGSSQESRVVSVGAYSAPFGGLIVLQQSTCSYLLTLQTNPRGTTDRKKPRLRWYEAAAARALLHEAAHVKFETTDEARAECYMKRHVLDFLRSYYRVPAGRARDLYLLTLDISDQAFGIGEGASCVGVPYE